jgi:hypothetical protein
MENLPKKVEFETVLYLEIQGYAAPYFCGVD